MTAATIERLSAEDRLMLLASQTWPQEVGALAILDGEALFDDDGRFRIEAVREQIAARLDRVPRFRQRVHQPKPGRGGALWVDDTAFDLGRHVRHFELQRPADERDLLRVTEQLRRPPLDPTHPLWRLWFITGLPDGRVALFVRIHHAVADGRAAMAMLGSLFDTAQGSPTTGATAGAWHARRLPAQSALVADNLRRRLTALATTAAALLRPIAGLRLLRAAWPATRELLAEQPASQTSLNRLVGPTRRLALVRGEMGELRRIAKRHDASMNEVVLALVAGGLRALLRSRGEPVDGVTIRAFVPVSLRGRLQGSEEGTLIAQMAVPVPLGVPDPVARLAAIRSEMERRKPRARTSLGTLFGFGFLRRLMLRALVAQRVNASSTYLPGPRGPVHLAGARLLEVFPLLNLIGNVSIGIGAVSCAGRFCLGVVADGEAYPDLDTFTAGVREELVALGGAGINEPRQDEEARVVARAGGVGGAR